MGRGNKLGTAGIAIATAVAGMNTSWAQEELPTPVLLLELGTEFRADDNADLVVDPSGTTYTVSELFGLTYLSETRTQTLRLSFSGALQIEDGPDSGISTDVDSPLLEFAYRREGANSALDLSAFYERSDVSDFDTLDDLTPEDLIVDSGTLRSYGADVALSFGTEAPVGSTVYARNRVRDYEDTSDPDLADNTLYEYGGSVDLRVSPVTEVSLNLDREDYSEEGPLAFDRNETSVSVGVTHELRRGLTILGELGYSQTETTEAGEPPDYDSVFGSVDFIQEVSNGSYSGGLAFEHRSEDSDRIWLEFGRAMDLRNGELSFGLTLTTTDEDDLSLLGSLDLTQEFKRSTLSVFLNQSIVSNDNDEDEQLSRLGVDYLYEINSVSNVTLAMEVSRTSDAGAGTTEEVTRADLTAVYTRELTPDWDLNVGYERQYYKEEGTGSADSNAVFVSLTRDFAFSF